MYITREEVEKILAVMDEFPDAKSFKLISDSQCSIGNILTLKVGTTIKDRNAEVSIEISGVENW
jgi:hypothetical protein